MRERLPLRLALLLPAGALAAAAVLAAAQWPDYWVWIAPEQTPMSFVQAILLFAASLFAALLALVSRIEAAPRGEQLVWALSALGFLYLVADERFALHERLRDNVLADFGVALPWGAPGDYLLLVFLLASLLVLPRLLRLLARDRPAFAFFAAGVALTLLVVAADTLDVKAMSVRTERLEQTIEEVVEALAAALFAGGLFLALAARLEPLAHVRQPEPATVRTGRAAGLTERAREGQARRARARS